MTDSPPVPGALPPWNRVLTMGVSTIGGMVCMQVHYRKGRDGPDASAYFEMTPVAARTFAEALLACAGTGSIDCKEEEEGHEHQ